MTVAEFMAMLGGATGFIGALALLYQWWVSRRNQQTQSATAITTTTIEQNTEIKLKQMEVSSDLQPLIWKRMEELEGKVGELQQASLAKDRDNMRLEIQLEQVQKQADKAQEETARLTQQVRELTERCAALDGSSNAQERHVRVLESYIADLHAAIERETNEIRDRIFGRLSMRRPERLAKDRK